MTKSKILSGKKLKTAINAAFRKYADRVEFDILDLGKLDRDVVNAYAADPRPEVIESAMVAALVKYARGGEGLERLRDLNTAIAVSKSGAAS